MGRMVQVAIAGDVSEAEELLEILRTAGIESELSSALDDPLTVLVPESSLEDAQNAIEAMTEPDDLISDA
jgi:hypothetical protein